jgi:hypothetical protein
LPNGHGGVPRFASPTLLLFVLGVLLWFRFAQDARWTLYPALVGAALFSWRLAWHMHLYAALEYGGAYTPQEIIDAARRRYLRTLTVLLPAGLIAAYLVWA